MKPGDRRHREGGTITVLATFLLVALFALAALAVDVGFLYTRSRMMYAVADSAVAAAMGHFVAGNTAAALTDVNTLATQYGGTYSFSFTPAPTPTVFSVKVTATFPLYFGKIFRVNSKQLNVTAAGEKGVSPPALLALGTVCGGGPGLEINGSGGMTINGDVDSNGRLNFQTGIGGGAHINGSASTPCPGGPLDHGTPGQSPYETVTGTYGTGPMVSDPFAPFTPPPCTHGSLTTGGDPTSGYWSNPSGSLWQLAAGVYCTTSDLTANGSGSAVDLTGVTFVLMGGKLNIGVTASSTMSAAAGSPHNIIAYSSFSGACSSGAAINIGGPAGSTDSLMMDGTFYAPNGCITAGSNSGTTLTGSFIANEIQLGDYGSWTIGTLGGGGASNWRMVQ